MYKLILIETKLQDKRTPRDCLKQGNIPSECQALRSTFFECKRSLVRLQNCPYILYCNNLFFL